MAAHREDAKRAVWSCDQLDCVDPPEVEAAYFDSDLGAWVLSRHADVLAAFHNPSLLPGRRELADARLEAEEEARLKMRDEVRTELSPGRTRAWREELRVHAETLS